MNTDFIFSEVKFRPFLCDPDDPDNQNPYGRVWWPIEKLIDIANVDFKGNSDPVERCPWWEAPHNVYYVYGNKNSDKFTEVNEAKWTTFLTHEEYERVGDSNHLLLGYMVVEHSNNDPLKVHYAKTFVRRKGILRLMISKMQDHFETFSWYPHDVSYNTALAWWNVWAKYIDNEDLDKMIPDAINSYSICKHVMKSS